MLVVKRSRIILILISFLILTALKSNNSVIAHRNVECSISPFLSQTVEPVIINSDDDFVSQGFAGNGSETNPYLIENLVIETTAISPNGIEVSNTNSYFIIRNCTITAHYIGVLILSSVHSGTAKIINNTITSSTFDGGGVGSSSYYTLIENNTISNFIQGIHLNQVGHCTIKGNNILTSYYQGINLRYSSYNEVLYNKISNCNQHGIAIVGSSSGNNLIHHNILVNNSNEETYDIDGERTGTITSQGFDEGYQNTWYHETDEHGNWWDDYDGKGDYSIDGEANSVDLYPHKYPDVEQTDYKIIIGIISIFALVIVNNVMVRKK